MGRRRTDSEVSRFVLLSLFLMGAISCYMIYLYLSVVFLPSRTVKIASVSDLSENGAGDLGIEEVVCCRGIEHLELWGNAVKWGSDFKVNSSEECCLACKAMCGGEHEPCRCDSWVFCGNREACGPRFGEVCFLLDL